MKSIQVIFNELGIKEMIQKWLRTRAQKEVDKLSPPNQKTGCSVKDIIITCWGKPWCVRKGVK